MTAIVISAFPGCGKTYLCASGTQGHVLDSDSSQFSWLPGQEGQVRNPDFPANYITHIQKHLDDADLILVSSHAEVRAALKEAGIPFVAVYPSYNVKAEYLRRYKERGSSDAFLRTLDENWIGWIQSMSHNSEHCIVLQSGEFLMDAVVWLLGLKA